MLTRPGQVLLPLAAAGLAAAALLPACGRTEAALDPFPASVATPVPDLPGAVFWARLGDHVPPGVGEAPFAGLLGGWCVVAGEGWVWVGQANPDTGVAGAMFRVGDPPEEAPVTSRPLPVGDIGFGGDLRAVLHGSYAPGEAWIDAMPAQAGLLASMLDQPDTEEEAYDLALAQSLAALGAELLPRLLGEVEGSASDLELSPHASLRFHPQPPLAQAEWGPVWFPRGMPQGIVLVRGETPAEVLWPRVVERLHQWGAEAPPRPRSDFAVEAHFLLLDGRPGLTMAYPAEWAPRAQQFAGLPAEQIEAGLTWLGEMLKWGEIVNERFEDRDSVFLTLAPRGFRESLQASLERDRPRPFAERRARWPRGSWGVILDYKSFQQAMLAFSPVQLPFMQGKETPRRPTVELLFSPDGGALRVEAVWPSPEQALGESAGRLGESVATQFLGTLPALLAGEAPGGLEAVEQD